MVGNKAYYHLPGLFEFYDLYKVFLPIFREHREYFYDWCEIGSIYGAPGDCIWGGGRVGFGDADPQDVASLMKEYGISSRLTFSNSLLTEEHLSDKKCNDLCALFEKNGVAENGIIECFFDTAGNMFRTAEIDQQAIFAIGDYFFYGRSSGSNHATAGRHGLQS